MGFAYKIYDQYSMYFVTFTVHQWVDVFTRPRYRELLIESLQYCQQNKGLRIYAWVVMSNHLHLIVSAIHENLSDVIRDFKKYTAKSIVNEIECNGQESRKDWLLRCFKKNEKIWFWEEGYHGVEITDEDIFATKLNYIHLNPVRNGLVKFAEDYLLSSAKDYLTNESGILEISFLKR